MRKILSIISGLFLLISTSQAQELSIEKQLVGIVGAVSGTVKTETRTLKSGDKIYLNETIYAGAGSGTQLLLLDQSTFTIGADSEVLMDTFIYDPATNDGKIVATVKEGSLKVISGLISKKDPDSLTVKVPEGTLGSRGTEFQTIVSRKNKRTDTLLIGPGKNNTLGLRPGAVLVGNKFGNTMLNNPYTVASMKSGKKPGKAKQITQGQLKKFKKRMKSLRVAKLEGASKEEKKALRKKIRKELKEAGLEKEEIKSLIKENIKIDKEKRIVLLKERGEDVSDLETPDQSIAEETTIEPDAAPEPELKVAEPKIIAEPEQPKKEEKGKKKKAKKKKGKNKLPKNMVRTGTTTLEDGSKITIKQTINRKTGKFIETRTITKPDGSTVTKKKKGKFKKKALNNLKKQEKKAALKPKPTNKKAKAKDKPKKKAKAKDKPKQKAKAKDKPKKKAKAKAKDKPKKKKPKAKAKDKPKKKKPKAKAKAKPKKKKPKAKAKPKKPKKKAKAKPKKKKPKKKAKPKKKKPKKVVKKRNNKKKKKARKKRINKK
tara:strand:+ start:49 stop:1680 length:1632 start_codon:yes stop_codon:yes gene_type:complete